LFSFLTPILSTCIITSSLIHEATTLIEKTLQVLRSPFIGSDCLLDQKGLFKTRNAGYGSWFMKERKIQAQKVFEGFKDLGSTSNYSSTLFLFFIVFVEKVTYNLINLKYQNSLNLGYMQIQLFL